MRCICEQMCTIGNRERRLFDLMKSTEMFKKETTQRIEIIHDQNANT